MQNPCPHCQILSAKQLLASSQYDELLSLETTFSPDCSPECLERYSMYKGIAETRLGRLNDAVVSLSSLLLKPSLSPSLRSHVNRHLGNALATSGNITEAIRHYSKAQQWYEKNNRADLVASCCGNIGAMFAQAGLFEEAIAYFKKAQEFYGKQNDRVGSIRMMCNHGHALFFSGARKHGVKLVLRSLRLSRTLQHSDVFARTSLVLLRILRQLGRRENVREHLKNCRSQCAASRVLRSDWLYEVCHWLIALQETQWAVTVCRRGYLEAYNNENESNWLQLLGELCASTCAFRAASHCMRLRQNIDIEHKNNVSVQVGRALAALENTRIEKERVEAITHARKLQKLNLRLETALQYREDMVRFVSHDLKTPLAATQLATDILTRYYWQHIDKKAQQLIKNIAINCSKQNLMIENLLSSEQLKNNQVRLCLKEIRLIDLLHELVYECSFLLEHRQQTMVIDCENAVQYTTDPTLFKLLLQNIIVNAITYTHKGGEIQLRYSNSEGTLSICDNGPGLEARRKPQANRLMTSHGLGSTIIQRYAHELGIETQTLSSQSGTTVVLYLVNTKKTNMKTKQTYGSA